MSSTILRLEIDGNVQSDINLNDIFYIRASGSSVSVQVDMQEKCKDTRTGAGIFKKSVTGSLSVTMNNLRDAWTEDYIDEYNLPLTISRGGVGNVQNISFSTDLETGIALEVVSVPDYVTIYETPLEPVVEIIIDSIEVQEADDSQCTYCKNKIILDSANAGVAPYTLTFGSSVQTDLGIDDLIISVGRLEAIDNNNYTFQITDSDNNDVTGVAAGLQSAFGNQVVAEYEAINANEAEITIKSTLQNCLDKDKEIILEAKVVASDGSYTIDWFEISNTRSDSTTTVILNNLNVGEAKISLRDNFGCTQLDKITVDYEEEVDEGYPVVSFPLSNALNFINKLGYSKPKHFTTRRFCDLSIKNSLGNSYYQKLTKDSNIWDQFLSETSSYKFEMIDKDYNVTDITSYGSIVKVLNGINWIQISPDLSSFEGIYQMKATFSESGKNDTIFLSEFFQVEESYDRTVTVKWKNDSLGYGYFDGIEWGNDYQEMIIDAEFIYPDNATEKAILIDTNNRMINLDTKNTAIDVLNIFRIPYYLRERFILGLGHYKFLVNDIEYQTEDTPELEPYQGSLLFKGEVQLRRVNYEIY